MNTTANFNDLFDLANKYFKVFVEEIIGLKNAEFHDELDDILSDELYKKIAISFPRDHGKSTHISVCYVLWKIAKDHNLRILLISKTSGVAQGFLSEIVGHIENNEMYQKFAKHIDPKKVGVFPKVKKLRNQIEKWSSEQLTIERDNLNLKDPTINATGVFGSILSKRADIIIGDDIVDQVNSATELQRLKVITWFYTTILPVLVPNGELRYLGNTWHQDDLVAHLFKDPQFDYKKRIPAIKKESDNPQLWEQWAAILLDESKELRQRKTEAEAFYNTNRELMDKGVEVLWPERYPYKELYLKRLSNGYAFSRMYQCDPSNRPDQKFRDEWLENAVRKGASLKLQDDPFIGITSQVTTEGLDLAISEKSTSDDCVLLTLDRVKFSTIPEIKVGDIIVRNIKRGKFTPNQVREMVKKDSDYIRPDGIRVETVGYQEAIKRDLDEAGYPVTGYHTGGEKNDPYIGVNSLAVQAELGKLVLPYSNKDPRTLQLVAQLMNEMRAFPDGHTGDSLMALWFAYSEMRDLLGDKITIPSTLSNPINIDPPDLSNPVVLKAEEKKADTAIILEQQYELQEFHRLMHGG